MAAVVDDRTLRVIRIFDASRERVFDAWTDNRQFAEWFGPPGVRTIYCELDAREGGAWRLLTQGTERTFAVSGRYLEVKRPDRLVFTFGWHNKGDHALPRGHETTVRVEFRALGGKTEVTMTQGAFLECPDVESHTSGWTASLDKLDALIRRTA